MKPLTVGNVVSAGLQIYRDRFKEYFRIAFIGYLWVLVPFYGWAKFAAMNGLIARLAFREVIEKPETEQEARRHIRSRMWQFLIAGILVGLIVFFGFFFILFFISFTIGIIGSIIGLQEGSLGYAAAFFLVILGVIGFILLIIALTWLISRYLIVELPLAVEENITARKSLGRSWDLTKGSVVRLQIIVFVSFLISLPISIVIQIVSTILQIAIASLGNTGNDFMSFLFYVGVIVIGLAGGALLIPFWQAIKAVIYYDLRVRREGLGIELEKNN